MKILMNKSQLLKGGWDLICNELAITCTIARFGKEVNIQSIMSYEQGRGNCQKFIKELLKNAKKNGLKLVSSTPINPAWRHIAEKFDLKIYE